MRFWRARINTGFVTKLTMSLAAVMTLAAGTAFGESSTEQQRVSDNVVYEQDGVLSSQLHMPLYTWRNKETSPKGVILAVHGLAMHGKAYDSLARAMANDGMLVVATDLRGYGRNGVQDDHAFCHQKDCKRKINYEKSYEDLVSLVRELRNNNPDLPLFAVGESLGGSLIIRIAAQNPNLVDGLILSAPAIKPHSFIDPAMLANATMMMANPRAQLDIKPWVRKFSSEDPQIVEEISNDPLLRNHLSAYELFQSRSAVLKTMSYISSISPETPVLVIQGSADRCIKANAVVLLLSKLRSSDQTVKWFHQRGHILLETAHVKPDTMDTVLSWTHDHVNSAQIQAKVGRHFTASTATEAHPAFLSIRATLLNNRSTTHN